MHQRYSTSQNRICLWLRISCTRSAKVGVRRELAPKTCGFCEPGKECKGRVNGPPTQEMSQFLYIQFKVTPKGTLARPSGNEMIAIELPSNHVADWKLERPGLSLSDDEVAVQIAEPVAIATADRFVPLTHRPLLHREIHSAKFLPVRPSIMNERNCDYEDNGIRAWFSV
jgi:hypothetical protein